MEAAVLLGVNYRTLVKAEESGEMTGRMSDALERLLLTWDGGAEDGDGGRWTTNRNPAAIWRGGWRRWRRDWRNWPASCAAGLMPSGPPLLGAPPRGTRQAGQGKPAARPGRGEKGAPAQSPPAPPPVAGLNNPRPARLRRVDPELVTREPAGDDAEVYGDAWPLVKEWRELKDRLPVRGRSLSWLTDYERLLTLELAMLEEHELTLPPQKQPVRDSLSRRDHTRWRWKALRPDPGVDPEAQAAALAAPVAHAGGVVELGGAVAVKAGSGVGARRPEHFGELAASAGQAITAGRARCLQNPFPVIRARAIINAVYGFFQSFPPESWRVHPRPGPFARDRASLSPRRPQ